MSFPKGLHCGQHCFILSRIRVLRLFYFWKELMPFFVETCEAHATTPFLWNGHLAFQPCCNAVTSSTTNARHTCIERYIKSPFFSSFFLDSFLSVFCCLSPPNQIDIPPLASTWPFAFFIFLYLSANSVMQRLCYLKQKYRIRPKVSA